MVLPIVSVFRVCALRAQTRNTKEDRVPLCRRQKNADRVSRANKLTRSQDDKMTGWVHRVTLSPCHPITLASAKFHLDLADLDSVARAQALRQAWGQQRLIQQCAIGRAKISDRVIITVAVNHGVVAR